MSLALMAMFAIAPSASQILPIDRLARENFGNDAAWYAANIPFLECSDKRIEQIYYYRWKTFKAHIRDVGERGTVITEFLDDVGWQKWPFASLNDATPFHIKEGRWLRDARPVDEYIDYLYAGGGNDRHFSEGIAEATYANYLVRGDLAFAAKYLPAMRHIYNLWDDHYDFSKGLYWIEPLLDATEYTISSIDASGGKDGFRGGDSFRPTINAYQYGNARAIARLAALTGDKDTAHTFERRADELKAVVQRDLWSDEFEHFIDRYQVNNEHVKYWSPIRGRELAGYVPWVYHLPDDNAKFGAAWQHILKADELGGPHGLRTVEPSYQYYMRQYRYLGTQPECQWNGPSWPFQTTQVLTGLANLLNDYHAQGITSGDYLRLLKQYTDQHYLDGTPNLQEDYNPATGKPIVGLDRSHHYNHSGYVDLIVTGLAGIRPQEGDSLVVNPLVADEKYLCLENVPYHGHLISVIWDADGSRYGHGKGLSVLVDGKTRASRPTLGRLEIHVGRAKTARGAKFENLALNIAKQGYPIPTTSSDSGDTKWQAIDGRAWFFPEMVRGWSTEGSTASSDWFALDFGTPKRFDHVRLQCYEGGGETTPSQAHVEVWRDGQWQLAATAKPVANGPTEIHFPVVESSRVRLVFEHAGPMRLVELEVLSSK